MSQYLVVECEIDKEKYIVEGLKDMGFSMDEIEIHQTSQTLMNYNGQPGPQKGNIIVRRKYFKQRTKSGWNADLGFEKVNDSYKIHVNSEEKKWWSSKEPRFKQIAAACKVTDKARREGYHVRRTENGENIKLTVTKNF
jgi:hypothetical protein